MESQEKQAMAIKNPTTMAKEGKQDILWIFGLYGTAIGAGTLFLPIDAGLHGLMPLVIITILAFPMTYYSHLALCQFVLSGASSKKDITAVVNEHFGTIFGHLLTFLYFFSIYPILLMYSVAITNTTESFITHQLGLPAPPRALLALILISGLMVIIRFGQQSIVKFMSCLVYPFVATLMFLAIHLIPHWNGSMFHQAPSIQQGSHHPLMTLWLVIPVMVFSFNHSPIISSFAVSQKQRFGIHADKKCARILKISHILMVCTVMFFVFSCVFSLSPQDLILAKQENISILSYLANHFHTSFIAWVAPIIAFVAVAKSFLGHYLGASEGLAGLVNNYARARSKTCCSKILKNSIEGFIVVTCCITATLNPNILKMIESLGGPVIAMILFLMPMYAMAKVPAMKKYKNPLIHGFITIMGIIAISAIVYGLFND